MMEDLFSAQPLIIAQLLNQVSAFRVVRGARDLASIRSRPGTAPAAYVLYDGLDAGIGADRAQMVQQKWMIVTVVRNAREAAWGVGERQEAGLILRHVCHALLGWRPGPDHGPLTLIHAPSPSFDDAHGFYPLRFSSRTLLHPP